MKRCTVGAVFRSDQIINSFVAWKGRITCIEVVDRGFKFRREHPYYNGETFVLDQANLDKSFWVAGDEPSLHPSAEFWAIRFPGDQLPDWTSLSTNPPPQKENWETVRVTVEPTP